MFKHTDGKILIDDGHGPVRIPFSEFKLDEAGYNLPPEAVGRFYNGTHHKILYPTHQINGPLPYGDGDNFISRKQFYLDQIALRNPVPAPPPPLTDAERIDQAFPQTGPERVLFKILFKIINRVLALESPPSSMTPAQFRTLLINEFN